MRSVLRALGALTAVFAWAGGLVLAVPSAHAAAASPQPLAISITGMTPSYATRGSTVTLTGTLANHTGAAVSGLTVQAETSPQNFTGRAEMTGFTRTGSYPYPGVLPAGQAEVTGTVRDGQTIRWSVSFQAGSFSTIGVFPVQVAAATPGGTQTAAARTLLPYWPGSGSFRQAKDSQLQVAWIWPLADTPQQGACGHTLATNELAGSVDGGRLSALVGAAASWASADDLTWDIDPALLSDVSVMKGAYYTGGTGTCSSRVRQPPSKAAARWLGQLRQASTGRPAFLTPYANVDVAALSHAGLDGNVRSAYQLGQTVAGQILPGTFGDKGTGTAGGAVLKAAWPAGGLADAGVLTSLATYGGISTAVLSSGAVSSVTPGFDNAIARTQVSGIGTAMSVLLADDQMTSLLGATPAKPTASGQFAYTQDYLAQTAMIVSEAPGLARSLVVAPPPDWNPSASEAAALLRTTHDMPWLKTTGLSALAAQAAKQPPASAGALPAKKVSGDELSASSVAGLKSVNSGLSLFTNLLYQPSPAQTDSLRGAVAVAASSAWRGAGAAGGRRATVRLQRYLSSSEAKVQIIPITKVLLAGNSGETPVSVKNGLGWPVQVRVTASAPAASTVRVGPHEGLLTVMGGKTNTVRMPVHATSIGTTTVQLQLVTQDGSPLGTAQSLSVEVTRVGRFLLTIIGGALGILVLTSVYQLRRKRLARTRSQGTADHAGDAGGAG